MSQSEQQLLECHVFIFAAHYRDIRAQISRSRLLKCVDNVSSAQCEFQNMNEKFHK